MKSLSWIDLRGVKAGTRVKFVTSWDIYPYCVVPEGTIGTVTENIYGEDLTPQTLVLPDDPNIRDILKEWDGNIQFLWFEDADVGECPLATLCVN